MHALYWLLIVLLIAAGMAGTVFPLLPDTPLILAAAALQHFLFAPNGVGWTTLAVLCALMLCSLALDLLSGSVGAKYFGATRWGAIGGILGGVVGLFFGIPGLFFGPLAGVLLGELLGGKGLLPAGRSAWGTLLGTVAGMVAKVVIGLTMVSWFFVAVIFHILS